MNRKQSSWLAFSLLLLGQLAGGVSAARAGDFNLQNTVAAPDTDSKDSSNVDAGLFSPKKFNFTFDSRIGYDSNTLAEPETTVTFTNANGVPVNRKINPEASAFLNFDLGATYTAQTSRTTLSVASDVGVSYYFDRPGRKYDVNGGLSLLFTYKLAPRLFLELSSYDAYVSEGDFGASNLTNFNGAAINGIRAPGTTDNNLNGDYFYTSDTLQLSYQLSERISLVTGYSIVAFAYDDSLYATIEDRVEQYFSEEFRYLLNPQLTLAADYRFAYVDYFSVNNDSYTNFVLGGFDYIFSPRLRGSIRGGVEFRQYPDAVGDETSPYAEGTLTYNLSRRANLALIARYGIEEGDLTTDVTNSNTVRLGISYNQAITARISGYLSFYYTHSLYQTPSGTVIDFNEDTYDVALGLQYAITRHLSLEAGYTHTTVDSQIDSRSYNRERVFGGVRLAF